MKRWRQTAQPIAGLRPLTTKNITFADLFFITHSGLMVSLKNASLAGLMVAIIAMISLVIRDSLFAVGVIAITIQILAAILMLWARLTFGSRSFHASADPTEGGLMTKGPYRYIRHPIYAALMYFGWAGILSHPSTINILLGIAMTAGLAVRIFAEEHLLVQRYPEYANYANRTKRIIPYII